MDEPVSLLVAERRRDEQWIDTLQVAENDLDFNPKSGNAQQLLDSSFGLELELAEALGLRMLRMDFQPQFDLGSGRGCEPPYKMKTVRVERPSIVQERSSQG